MYKKQKMVNNNKPYNTFHTPIKNQLFGCYVAFQEPLWYANTAQRRQVMFCTQAQGNTHEMDLLLQTAAE